MLNKCCRNVGWKFVSVVRVIQHASPLTFSFNVESKLTTDMLLPVILSELVDSADEKLRRVKTREWISFFNLYFFRCLCILSLVWLPSLFPLSSTSSAASWYSSLCSCNLDRWSEFLCCCWRSFRFDVYSCMIFYCYDFFAERFSFVESFEIRSDVLKWIALVILVEILVVI